MNIPTFPRLILFTLSVLMGAVLLLTEWFGLFWLGFLLFFFSDIVLKTKEERAASRKERTTPLTKWQIARGFMPLAVILLVTTYILATDRGREFSQTTDESTSSVSIVFKIALLLFAAFMIGRRWWHWHCARAVPEYPAAAD